MTDDISTHVQAWIYRLLLLKYGPHRYKIHGIGIKATVINPNKEVAHENPSLSRMVGVMRGKEAEMKKRMNVNAANIDAL